MRVPWLNAVRRRRVLAGVRDEIASSSVVRTHSIGKDRHTGPCKAASPHRRVSSFSFLLVLLLLLGHEEGRFEIGPTVDFATGEPGCCATIRPRPGDRSASFSASQRLTNSGTQPLRNSGTQSLPPTSCAYPSRLRCRRRRFRWGRWAGCDCRRQKSSRGSRGRGPCSVSPLRELAGACRR